jgi:uncharacterized membrane protein YcaP (DUF421 family)
VPPYLLPFVDATVMVVAVIALTRLAGLRSFSKMSGYDFAITVAMGSVLASVVVTESTGAVAGVCALVALFVLQVALSFLRRKSETISNAMDNAPLMIMRGSEILDDNLAAARMTREDLYGRLREVNVHRLSDVRAVVLERTGNIAVLHGDAEIDEVLLQGVRDRP